MATYQVCWKTNPDSVTVRDATGMPVDPIRVAKADTLVFKTDNANSDASVQGFLMRIDPKSPDIQVVLSGGTTVEIYDKCSQRSDVALNMTLHKDANGYVIDSGKPIIRNDPSRAIKLDYRIVLAVGLLALAAVLVYYLMMH